MGVISLILIGVSIYMINTSINAKVNQLQVMANGQSAAVIEKIDRNFYERFGDVQAFAFNKLATEMASTDTVTFESQQFINTMISYYVLYDLMMVCDINGKVVAANTVDKAGKMVKTDFIISKNFSNDEWFRACISGTGPEGGAWYSDFMENKEVSTVYGHTGWGMAFAAPIRNNNGKTVGVWYNFANWDDVTVGIRKETEAAIRQSQPGAFVLVTNAENQVIDSDDAKMILSNTASLEGLTNDAEFEYNSRKINLDNYIVGGKKGTGAYIYKGNNWNALTFIPRTKFSLGHLFDNLTGFLSVILLVLIGIGFMFNKVASSVSKDINSLKTDIEYLSKGELVEVADTNVENEIGKITNAIKLLAKRMGDTTHFAKQIGEGNFDTDYVALSEKDVLGRALVTMRDNLQKIKEEEKSRAWATEGATKFGEILRNQSDLAKLGDEIIINLVKYINANQGGIFIVNDDNQNDIHLNLLSSYAWEKKKFLEKRINSGEGLVGQCWIEKETIYLTKIPNDYIKITSGLGEAVPNCIIILPLKLNGSTFGVIELASFYELLPYQRGFLDKLCENIASTLFTVKVNSRTKLLLVQSQQQSQELRSQEEEMRQNMEELSATQEEIARKEKEYLSRINELEMLLKK